MKKLDRFILKAFAGPFVAILALVVFILVLQFLWLYIDELVGKGLGFAVIMEFMMWATCTILPTAMPLATLLASMMVLGQMSENKELMAMKASGMSLARVMTPLGVAAALISVGAFFVGNNLVPKAYNEIYQLREDIRNTKSEIKIPSGTFYDGIDGYILRIDDRNKETGMMYGVMVYDHSGRKGNTSLTMADSSMLKMSKDKKYLTFSLYNGCNYRETNERHYRDSTFSLQRIDFESQELVIPLSNYTFEKSDSSAYGDQVKAMQLKRLRHDKDSLDAQIAEQHDAHYKRLRLSSGPMLKNQLDTAANGGLRTLYQCDELMKFRNVDEIVRAYEEATASAEKMQMDLMTYSSETSNYYFYSRRTDIELFKKFAQALACFILFFVGAPLGAMTRKGGLGAGAIVSVLFFVLYWVVGMSGEKLARDGSVAAYHGVFSAAYVLIPIGAFLTWKAINDSELFNMDSLKSWWRKLRSRVTGLFRKTRIVYMGTPEFAVAPLDNLVKHGYNIVGVVTVADKPSGRGLKVNESAVKKYAVEHGIPVLQPVKLKDPEFLAQLRAWKADMFVVVAFRMLPEEVWTMPKLGTFNLHAALLPQYRGAAPINWAVINGERVSGVTTFMIDKDIDTGGIILRQDCRIDHEDTAGDLHDKLMEIGSGLVLDTVGGIIERNVETRVQRSFIQGSEELKPAPKLTRELCHIDWNDRTEAIHNLIRGLSPYPTAFTELVPVDGEAAPVQLKIFKAEKVDLNGRPGEILSDGKTYMAIATADGAISIRELQLQGKKRMSVSDFLRGFREPSSYRCTEGTSKAEIEKTHKK